VNRSQVSICGAIGVLLWVLCATAGAYAGVGSGGVGSGGVVGGGVVGGGVVGGGVVGGGVGGGVGSGGGHGGGGHGGGGHGGGGHGGLGGHGGWGGRAEWGWGGWRGGTPGCCGWRRGMGWGAGVYEPLWDPYLWDDVPYDAPLIPAVPAYAPSPAWYYCRDLRTYYPYVQRCASPWQAVPAKP
jgi:hypothetical protein